MIDDSGTLKNLGGIRFNVNGTLTNARDQLLTPRGSYLIGGDKFVFLTRDLKLIHPKTEHIIQLTDLEEEFVRIKILPELGKFAHCFNAVSH